MGQRTAQQLSYINRHEVRYISLTRPTRSAIELLLNDRILKVGKTITNLAGEENLLAAPVAEVVHDRTIDRMQ